ncbi:aromatic ring-hydroxylating oxygenase subunit alpha [Pseudomonas nitroreducens]|uniref:aromatic ring-hydroxylating oxygenase subunit alpha n=1 Tax=Pseudomonas nitroreducens TaxID=46680 RepID=UPI0028AEAE20|nr:aromatic ring-hydroxylating dioxygenase subunit alpha [Pseudomonas nitroreducens]
MNTPAEHTAIEGNDDNHTLPSWIYNDARYFELEREELLARSWQIACHISEIANPGDYITREFIGERIAVARTQDGQITAFHNTCRHRAHQVITGQKGNCKRAHVCPYHGWTYASDGRIRGIPGGSEADLEQVGHGLLPVEHEVFMGFVFIRLKDGGESVAERLAPFSELLAAYRIDEMQSTGEATFEEHQIDWKNMMDNYQEGYHVAIGHPGLNQMMDSQYDIQAIPELGVTFASHKFKPEPAGGPDEFTYMSLRPDAEHLPRDHGQRISYLSLFPLVNIGLQPDSIHYYIFYPLGPGRAAYRTESFSLPNVSLRTEAAQVAMNNVWDQVVSEDNQLTRSVQLGLEGGAYKFGFISPREPGLRAFRDWMRARLPIVRLETRPPVGEPISLT